MKTKNKKFYTYVIIKLVIIIIQLLITLLINC